MPMGGLSASPRAEGQQASGPGGEDRSPGGEAGPEERGHLRVDGGERPRKKKYEEL